MNKRFLAILALTLCVGAFLFPTAAYAASDTTPPTVRAWINSDLLHVEAFDDTGVESAYINSARVNYRVDGSFDLLLRDYAGSGEYIAVYAVDFAGNKSNVVELKNPYYVAPTATPTPAPTTPAPTTPPATSTPKPTPKPTQTPSAPATPSPEPTESAVPAEQKPFTPDGTGTVVDNVVEQNGKEFFTITTAAENVFYLIIDRQRDNENVYLLNAVTEDDLAALAKKGSGGTSQSAVPTPETTPIPTPTPEPTPEPEPPTKEGGNTSAIILVLLAVAGVGGAAYYFKIVKPKQQAPVDDDDYDDEDDSDYGGESDYPGESEDDYDRYDEDISGDESDEKQPEPTPEQTESAVPSEQKPFTPDGTGTVVDNVVEQNGKEFFTITTADDNVFYLIIDRQRDNENVYLLNAVTEDDLAALAKKGSSGTSQSAVPTPEPVPTPTPEPTPEPEPPAKEGGNTSAIILVLLAVAGVGGAAYYFKIVKPKQQAPVDDDYDDEDDSDYGGESDYPGESEDDYDRYDEDISGGESDEK